MGALFSKAEQERIVAAVAAAEARTSAEFVVATVERSEGYSAYRAGAAGLATWSLTMLVHTFAWELSTEWVFLAQLPLAAAFWWLFGQRVFLLPLVPNVREQRAVFHAAERLYAELDVHRTSGQTGVLILLSHFERRVQLLGDSAVNNVLKTEGWERHAQALVAGWKTQGAADAVVHALESLSQELSGPLPRTGEPSQRPNEIVSR